LAELDLAVLNTIVYADIFDYPLELPEVHRYLLNHASGFAEVQNSLKTISEVGDFIQKEDDYYFLTGREAIVETRRQRAAHARRLWPRVILYARLIAGLPYVRMVAVTGALAMNNETGEDIDFFIVSEPGRLWICRAAVLLLRRIVILGGDILCPNFFVSRRALRIMDQNLYTAHELVQMVPLVGWEIYQSIRRENAWSARYLPNAGGAPGLAQEVSPLELPAQRVIWEALLRSRPGSWIEKWEMDRKIQRFRRQNPENLEASFSVDWCKGHFNAHGKRTLQSYADRLQQIQAAQTGSRV
jgi:hypothetical protein